VEEVLRGRGVPARRFGGPWAGRCSGSLLNARKNSARTACLNGPGLSVRNHLPTCRTTAQPWPLQPGWLHGHLPLMGWALRHWSLQNSLPAWAVQVHVGCAHFFSIPRR